MDSLVVVYKAAGLPEAEIIRGYLESEEIPVHLQYESAGPVYGLTVNGLGEVRVCVPGDLADDARQLLKPLARARPSTLSVAGLRAFVSRARRNAGGRSSGGDRSSGEPEPKPPARDGDGEADPAA
jgi:hypothetical protein